jgi:hypothetical protein
VGLLLLAMADKITLKIARKIVEKLKNLLESIGKLTG